MPTLSKTSPGLFYTYVVLWVVGRLQEMLITSSIISLALYIPFLLMTFVFVYKVIILKPKGMMLMISIFFVTMLLYGVFNALLNSNGMNLGQQFIMTLFGSMGPIFTFYIFCKQGLLTENRLIKCFIIFLILSIIEYHITEIEILNSISGRYDEVTNNTAYFILGLFPFVFIMKKRPIIQYIILAIIVFYVISGMKRGAIVVMLMLLLWFVYVMLKSSTGKRKNRQIILISLFVILGVQFILDFYSESSYFQYRIQSTIEGSSSNRDIIYTTLWNHFLYNHSFLELLFGEGIYQTITITGGVKAHNDWLELLIDCGFFGVLLYVAYWFEFIRELHRWRNNGAIYSILGVCLIYTFMRTLFSMSFTDIPFFMAMMMGYCFGSQREHVQ